MIQILQIVILFYKHDSSAQFQELDISVLFSIIFKFFLFLPKQMFNKGDTGRK